MCVHLCCFFPCPAPVQTARVVIAAIVWGIGARNERRASPGSERDKSAAAPFCGDGKPSSAAGCSSLFSSQQLFPFRYLQESAPRPPAKPFARTPILPIHTTPAVVFFMVPIVFIQVRITFSLRYSLRLSFCTWAFHEAC